MKNRIPPFMVALVTLARQRRDENLLPKIIVAPALLALFTFNFQPSALFAAATVTQIAAGFSHSLFVESDGSLWGFGANDSGQLGIGFAPPATNVPVQILPSSNNVLSVAAGGYHSLFRQSGGSLWAMGYNGEGQLGDGTYMNHYFPEQIVASHVSVLAAGYGHSLFGQYYTSAGFFLTMGRNLDGQLGDGTLTNTNKPEEILSTSAPPFPAPYAVTLVAAGKEHSLFVRPGGSLWAMGWNGDGQLGDGTTNQVQRTPEQILSSGVAAVAAGYFHSLFIKSDRGLWAMGNDNYGQLGDNSTLQQRVPEQVGVNVMAVAGGAFHSLVIKSDGSLWAMGYNSYGQLGDGTTTTHHLPVLIVPSNVVAVAAGENHSLFIKSDGSLWAMGWNSAGQLGDGTYYDRHTPVQVVPLVIPQPAITNIGLAGANLALNGTNGQSGRTYYTLMSTNVAQPLSQWTPVATNLLSTDGNFSFTATNAVSANATQQFYILRVAR